MDRGGFTLAAEFEQAGDQRATHPVGVGCRWDQEPPPPERAVTAGPAEPDNRGLVVSGVVKRFPGPRPVEALPARAA